MSPKRRTILELIRTGHGINLSASRTHLPSPFRPTEPNKPSDKAKLPPILDVSMFPHLVEELLLHLDRSTLKSLRGVHRSLRDYVDMATLVRATLTPQGFLQTYLGINLRMGLGNLDAAHASRIRHLKTSELTHGCGNLLGCIPPDLKLEILECGEHSPLIPAPLVITTTRLFGAELNFTTPEGFKLHKPVRAALNPCVAAEELVWIFQFKDTKNWWHSRLRSVDSFYPHFDTQFLGNPYDQLEPNSLHGGAKLRFPSNVKRVQFRAEHVPGESFSLRWADQMVYPVLQGLACMIADQLDDIDFTFVGNWELTWIGPIDAENLTFNDMFTLLVAQRRAEMDKMDGITHVFGEELSALMFADYDDTAELKISQIVPGAWV
ncbi:hypothetical protein CcaverHIS002_0307410 [Cutaneotrichosporon cavernicola]|uniref:F-box domain-containing protein n=1 Tax=Cutaneotrichosporon cavernicola TaxID=279322 RepID=A0AA48ID09_9TREE|nr:uncharacterized protein CcaverHIS019_0307320 [Cutaneotrichosporon cavernicola]BEI82873.1 hypothetical protein CcaverHIS002_0307410 [Cutaneotrichosporon cavernicola]BEI90662.1 hypothetical protein CcaverHIS019_0307320 [Cutaneotrichosporon cavernicola]BEI98440.1 hypothetical protein CcaverHIS631_0307390 [Cutaneotrichosporon cavernicola]